MHIGQMLLENGTITQEQLAAALQCQNEIGGQVGHILVKLGFVDEKLMTEFLAKNLDKKIMWLDGVCADADCMKLFPFEVLRKAMAFPISKQMGTVVIAMADPTDFAAVDELRIHSGVTVETVLAPQSRILELLDEWSRQVQIDNEVLEDPAELTEDDLEDLSEEDMDKKNHRHGLSDLVSELKRDVSGEEEDTSRLWSELPTRELLLRMAAVLIQKGILNESDLQD